MLNMPKIIVIHEKSFAMFRIVTIMARKNELIKVIIIAFDFLNLFSNKRPANLIPIYPSNIEAANSINNINILKCDSPKMC